MELYLLQKELYGRYGIKRTTHGIPFGWDLRIRSKKLCVVPLGYVLPKSPQSVRRGFVWSSEDGL